MDKALREQLIIERQFDELLTLQANEVQADPDNPEQHRQMAWVLAAMGRMSEAVAEQHQACQLRPGDVRYSQALEHYRGTLSSSSPEPRSSDVAEVFRGIHRSNHWQGGESLSGPGSGHAVTAPVRAALPMLLRGLSINSLLDAPCGDFGWLRTVDLGLERYTGVDIVPELIEAARAHAGDRDEFMLADITRDPLPRADLVLCRDCMVHLTAEQALAAIANFKTSGSTFLLTTTFYTLSANGRGSTGGWRPINLQRTPFSFPQPRLLIPEREYDPEREHSDKSLGLWEIAALPDTPDSSI